jgi:hypothetical protein
MSIIRTCFLDSAIESISNSLRSCSLLDETSMPPSAVYTEPDFPFSGSLSRAQSADNTRSYSRKKKASRPTPDCPLSCSQESSMFSRMGAMKHRHMRRLRHNFYVGLLTHGESSKIKRRHRSSSSTIEAFPQATCHDLSMSQNLSQNRSDLLWDMFLQ